MKLKKNDEVIVIAGRDKGRIGTISRVFPKDSKVLVAGVNMFIKHRKADPNRGDTGGRVEKEMPLHASNVAIYNRDQSRADRVGYRILEDGSKVRFYKSTGEQIS